MCCIVNRGRVGCGSGVAGMWERGTTKSSLFALAFSCGTVVNRIINTQPLKAVELKQSVNKLIFADIVSVVDIVRIVDTVSIVNMLLLRLFTENRE